MFEPQWQEQLSRKRQREEEESDGQVNIGEAMSGTLGFTEHRNVSIPKLTMMMHACMMFHFLL